MRVSTLVVGCITALTSVVNAKDAESTTACPSTTNHSITDPFYLKIVSHNKTLNDAYIQACHTGAAEEAPCVIFDHGPYPNACILRLNDSEPC